MSQKYDEQDKILFDTILRQPAELYLSVYSIVITFAAYGVNFLCFGGNRINIYGVSTDKARRKYVHNFRGNSQFSFLTRITLIYE